MRDAAGLLDLPGFSRFHVRGPGASDWLRSLVTGALPRVGRVGLVYFADDRGRIVTEMSVTRLGDDEMLLIAAGAAEWHDRDWLRRHLPAGSPIAIENRTEEYCCQILSGPRSREILRAVSDADPTRPWLDWQRARIAGREVLLLRVSYVGELGWEIHSPVAATPEVFDAVWDAGGAHGLRPFGMFALDSLRLEKGYRAWKGDLSTDYTVLQGGLARFVRWEKPAFKGRAALERELQQGVTRSFATLVVDAGECDAPYMSTVWRDGQIVGETTSGGWGHRVGASIALAMVRSDLAAPGTGSRSRSTANAARPWCSPTGPCTTRRTRSCGVDAMTDAQALVPTRIGSRRGGGRAARRAARAAPLPESLRPVRAGLEGGAYAPLSEAGIARIHETALRALEEIGLADAPPSGVEALTSVGAALGEDGRVRIPRRVVEKMLAVAARDVTLCGQDAGNDIRPGGTRVHYGTAGAAVHVYDPALGDHRDPTMRDLYDSARLVDALDNIHFFQRTLTCRDTEDPTELDLNTLYVCVHGTTKHVGTSFTSVERARRGLDMLHRVAGSEAAWRARPFVSNSNCFVVPPLRFATESCEVMEALIRGGMPILLLSAGQAGATAPASLAGAVARRSPNASRGWSTSTRSRPATPPSSAPGRSSPTFAPARCPAARGSRRSSAPHAGRWPGTTTCRAARRARCPTPRRRTCRRGTSAGSQTPWPGSRG